MKKQTLLLIAGSLLLTGSLFAQASQIDALQQQERSRDLTEVEKQRYASGGVPALYEGEMEDLGPQLLLVRKPKPKLWEFYADVQAYHSTNVALAENFTTNSDVLVTTGQFSYLIGKRKFFDWDMNSTVGVRYQLFRYDFVSNDKGSLGNGTSEIDALDFDSRAIFANAVFTKGKWRASTSLTYTSLVSAHATEGNFYYEWVPAWSLGRLYEISPKLSLFAMYDGNYRETTTPGNRAFGISDGFSDKTDHAINAIFTRQLENNFVLQSSLRGQYSYYTDESRSRTDFLFSANSTLSYQWNEYVSLRIYASYEKRDSDETVTADYDNFNIGTGISGVYQF